MDAGRSRGLEVAALLGSALGLACANASQTAAELAQAAGEGAVEGFYQKVVGEQAGSWSTARGVEPIEGIATRSAAAPDCSDVSDEYLQLYDLSIVEDPQAWVPVIEGRLTRARSLELAGAFRLDGPRSDGVIAVVRTSAGNPARLVIAWSEAETPTLLLRDVVVWDGARGEPLRRAAGPVTLPAGNAIDLDPGETTPGAEDFDLVHGIDGDGEPYLAAAGRAGASFPTRSLCPPERR